MYKSLILPTNGYDEVNIGPSEENTENPGGEKRPYGGIIATSDIDGKRWRCWWSEVQERHQLCWVKGPTKISGIVVISSNTSMRTVAFQEKAKEVNIEK